MMKKSRLLTRNMIRRMEQKLRASEARKTKIIVSQPSDEEG
jgi:hypothetical protein